MQKQKQVNLAVAAMLLAAVLTGCGASSKASNDTAMTVAETMAGVSMAEETAADAGAGGSMLGAMPEIQPGAAAKEEEAPASTPEEPAAASRKLIRTVYLTMETTEFDVLMKELTQAIEDLGGYVESSSVSGSSILASSESQRYASLAVRIPSNRLDGFLDDIGSRGNITNRSESTEDVTLQYTDIEGRKKALKIEQDRLLELLAQADSMDAVIALESRLSEIRYQLESMESQLRTYDNQVDYSTVHIDLSEVKVFTPTSPDSISTRIQKGFSKNLKSVSDGLIDFFVLAVTSLPSLVVLAVVILIIALILRTVIRFDKRHTQKKLPQAKETDSLSDSRPENEIKN